MQPCRMMSQDILKTSQKRDIQRYLFFHVFDQTIDLVILILIEMQAEWPLTN